MKASKSDGRQNGGFRESRYGNPVTGIPEPFSISRSGNAEMTEERYAELEY